MAELAVAVDDVDGPRVYYFDAEVAPPGFIQWANANGYVHIPAESRYSHSGMVSTTDADRYYPVSRLISVA